ncbi:MAG: type I 3-dehydroquinate dehydratase [Prevotellaceae bacterium]|jgi:3-dehydroquinate dehydratase type I|nr:type I 3-dehydroquinate dehydratase [Prevotellaceae bacterium]
MISEIIQFNSICVSIGEQTYSGVIAALEKVDFAEIRLDMSRITSSEIRTVFSLGKQLVATCREGFYDRNERLDRLIEAVRAGAAFVDVETEADEDFRKAVAKQAKLNNCKLIVSYHNFEETPSLLEMCDIVDICKKQDADLVKLVTTAKNKSDASRVLSLYDKYPDTSLVAFAMGAAGLITRVACLFLGAPYTYAAVSDDKPLANGQISVEKIQNVMNNLRFKINE